MKPSYSALTFNNLDFHRLACEHGLEGIVSKRTNGRYEPDRRTWLKTKCLNREEFVVVGWSDPEGSRHRIGSLLLGYYTPDDKLIYAGRAGTGMPVAELERLWQRLQPLVSALHFRDDRERGLALVVVQGGRWIRTPSVPHRGQYFSRPPVRAFRAKVRSGLAAGAKWIRTSGSAPDKASVPRLGTRL
jgi:hypothetical protein